MSTPNAFTKPPKADPAWVTHARRAAGAANGGRKTSARSDRPLTAKHIEPRPKGSYL